MGATCMRLSPPFLVTLASWGPFLWAKRQAQPFTCRAFLSPLGSPGRGPDLGHLREQICKQHTQTSRASGLKAQSPFCPVYQRPLT